MTVDRARVEHAERLGKVLDGLSANPVTIPVLGQRLGLGVKEAREALAELLKLGKVARDDVGRYMLPAEPGSAPAQATQKPARRRIVIRATAEPVAASTPDPEPTARGGRPPSRINEVVHLLGIKSDREIAELLGLKRDTVKKFRKERGIKSSAPRGPRRREHQSALPFTAAGVVAPPSAPAAAAAPKAPAAAPTAAPKAAPTAAPKAAPTATPAVAPAVPAKATPASAPAAPTAPGPAVTSRSAWMWTAHYDRNGSTAEERLVAEDAQRASMLAATLLGTLLSLVRGPSVRVAAGG